MYGDSDMIKSKTLENDLLPVNYCLWLLSCKVKGLQGAAYADTAGTESHPSRKYVQEAGLEIRQFAVPTEVSLA